MATQGRQRLPALAIMAREPRPGLVKTRLQPGLSAEQSAGLYRAMLLDVMDMALHVNSCARFLFFTPSEAKGYFVELRGPHFTVLPQIEGDLGQRMAAIFSHVSSLGYEPTVIIGTDCPTVQPEYVEKVMRSLASFDVCFGPARDGGYYLVGQRVPHPDIFRDIIWSTPRVLQDNLARVRDCGLTACTTDTCVDVDTFGDLSLLADEIRRLKQTPGALVPVATEEYLVGLDI